MSLYPVAIQINESVLLVYGCVKKGKEKPRSAEDIFLSSTTVVTPNWIVTIHMCMFIQQNDYTM